MTTERATAAPRRARPAASDDGGTGSDPSDTTTTTRQRVNQHRNEREGLLLPPSTIQVHYQQSTEVAPPEGAIAIHWPKNDARRRPLRYAAPDRDTGLSTSKRMRRRAPQQQAGVPLRIPPSSSAGACPSRPCCHVLLLGAAVLIMMRCCRGCCDRLPVLIVVPFQKEGKHSCGTAGAWARALSAT